MASTWRRSAGWSASLFGVWLLGAGVPRPGSSESTPASDRTASARVGTHDRLHTEPARAGGSIGQGVDGQAIIQDECPIGGRFNFWLQAGAIAQGRRASSARCGRRRPTRGLIGVSTAVERLARPFTLRSEGTRRAWPCHRPRDASSGTKPRPGPSNSAGANRLSSALSAAQSVRDDGSRASTSVRRDQRRLSRLRVDALVRRPTTMPHLSEDSRKRDGRADVEWCSASSA